MASWVKLERFPTAARASLRHGRLLLKLDGPAPGSRLPLIVRARQTKREPDERRGETATATSVRSTCQPTNQPSILSRRRPLRLPLPSPFSVHVQPDNLCAH